MPFCSRRGQIPCSEFHASSVGRSIAGLLACHVGMTSWIREARQLDAHDAEIEAMARRRPEFPHPYAPRHLFWRCLPSRCPRPVRPRGLPGLPWPWRPLEMTHPFVVGDSMAQRLCQARYALRYSTRGGRAGCHFHAAAIVTREFRGETADGSHD